MKKREWIIVAVLLAACIAAAFFLYRPKEAAGGVVAVISVDGDELRRVDLSAGEAYTFRIEEETGRPVSTLLFSPVLPNNVTNFLPLLEFRFLCQRLVVVLCESFLL